MGYLSPGQRESYFDAFWGLADWGIVERRYENFLRL
jgi:superoxide dismutase